MGMRDIMVKITEEARKLKARSINTEHALLALLNSGGMESKALATAGADYQLLLEYISTDKERRIGDRIESTSQQLKNILDDTLLQSKRNPKGMSFEELLLLNLLTSESKAKKALVDTNVDPHQVYILLVTLLIWSY